MSNLQFFDAHCYVGRYRTFKPGSFYSVDDLVQQMNYYGISEALVTHAMSREHHPIDGNAAVLAEIENHPYLHPSWSLLPSESGEQAPPAAFLPDMIAHGVKVAKIYYAGYSFPLSEWCIGDLLDRLEAHHMPTFLDPDVEFDTHDADQFDWDAVDSLCRLHPRLPVILSEARFRSSNRLLYQLFSAHPNLHMELSGYWVSHGIEFIVREFGARRLLFGTRMPQRNPACAVAQVTYADISEEDKKLIAGDNLRGLMKGVVQ